MTLALAAQGYRRIAFAGTPPQLEHRATQRLEGFLRAHGMHWQAQCYPGTVDELKPIIEHVQEFGFRSWRRRASAHSTLTFLCELGPAPYAITGVDGYELSDRWQEALTMKDEVRTLWARVAAES
ncbi:MAG: hypothetical protein RIS88_849 [Pseudomonadota bacterium]|jgi:hypothetical protein